MAFKGVGRDQTSLCLGRQKIPWSYYLFEALILGIPSTRVAQKLLAADGRISCIRYIVGTADSK
jgi:hypothetical protein